MYEFIEQRLYRNRKMWRVDFLLAEAWYQEQNLWFSGWWIDASDAEKDLQFSIEQDRFIVHCPEDWIEATQDA